MARKPGGRVVRFPKVAEAARRPKVVVTGGSGFFGERLVRALLARGDRDVVVFDLVPPADLPDVRHRFLDLNLPFADGTLFKLLKEERPDTIVHLAQLRSPSRQTTYAHELNSIGALHVFAAAGEAKIPRVILGSTSLVYGARGDNPNFLTEDHPLRPDPEDRFVRDFVEAESHARAHVRRHPEARVQILRFAPLLSPEVRDYRTRLFAAPLSWQLMGYDPLLQALDPDDAVDALVR
ncbi:MAG: NAD-dependent epimerase/dehydratase family protein, partial [Acidobacteriota bacterium]